VEQDLGTKAVSPNGFNPWLSLQQFLYENSNFTEAFDEPGRILQIDCLFV